MFHQEKFLQRVTNSVVYGSHNGDQLLNWKSLKKVSELKLQSFTVVLCNFLILKRIQCCSTA